MNNEKMHLFEENRTLLESDRWLRGEERDPGGKDELGGLYKEKEVY